MLLKEGGIKLLQISTGKFFVSDDLHIHDGKGILYTNYSWINSIDTCIGTIEPVDYHGNITSYVFSYKNKLEKDGVLVRTGDHEIIEQFKLIFSYFFQCFSDSDRNTVELNCRKTKRNMNDQFIPYEFAGRIFEPKIYGSEQEVKEFNVFLKNMIGLERSKYKKLIQCLEAYNNSLLALNHNFELAYSLLIYCLESLSQSFDNYEPEWEDYNQRIRAKLDTVLNEIGEGKSGKIKNILLEDSHLKLQTRLINFVSSNIGDDFFIKESVNVHIPLRKSELKQVLKNAYGIRSKYVHSLQSIMKQLKMPSIGSGEVFSWEGDPYLTYKGLLRLTHHVIKNYFGDQEYYETEEYHWKDELPGVVYLQLDEKYWIDSTLGFSQEQAFDKLNGFLSQLAKSYIFEKPLTNLTELMKIYEKEIPQSKKKYKLAMISNYILYNLSLIEEFRLNNYKKVIEFNQNFLDEPTIESILTYSILGQRIPYNASDTEAIYLKYQKDKFNSSSVKIPKYFELLLMLNLINKLYEESELDRYNEWLNKCILDVPGNLALQEYLIAHKEENSIINIEELRSKRFFLVNEQKNEQT